VTQQLNAGLSSPIVDIIRTHIHTYTNTCALGLLWRSEQVVTEAATYTTQNEHKGRTSLPSAGFELAIPKIKLPHT